MSQERTQRLLQKTKELKEQAKGEKSPSKQSKVVSISETAEKLSVHQKIQQVLQDYSPSIWNKFEVIFSLLFENRTTIPLAGSEYKQWQINLSKLILQGQRNFEFTNTISPMELTELVIVGYMGAVEKCKQENDKAFFNTWLQSNQRLLLA